MILVPNVTLATAADANIKTLAREKYFDGLAVIRSQDNYVVQWGDPEAENASQRRPLPRPPARRAQARGPDRPTRSARARSLRAP